MHVAGEWSRCGALTSLVARAYRLRAITSQ